MTPLPTLRALLTLFSLALLAGLAWYIYTDKPLSITPLGYLGSCIDDNAVGECRAYLVDNTSWLHRNDDKAALRAHALALARRRGGQGPLHVHYFRPTGWTKENQASISSNTLEELAQWDTDIHPLFPQMGSAFLCEVSVSPAGGGSLIAVVDTEFRYGQGHWD